MGIAVGAALTQQMHKTGKIVVCFFGDGATNEGVFHEAVNMASIWNASNFHCINNGYGISVDIKKMTNIQHIHERSAAYGIPGMFIPDGNNVIDVYEGFQKLLNTSALKRTCLIESKSLIVGLVTLHLTLVNTDPEEVAKSGRRKIRLKTFCKYLLENDIMSAENWIRSKKKQKK